MRRPLFSVLALLALACALAGCPRRIGDGCSTSTECSLNGDRICDLSQNGGYCTINNCAINSCPDNAACVEFYTGTREVRRFCVHVCQNDGDCRGNNYTCTRADLSANPSEQCDGGVTPAIPGVCTRQLDTNEAHLIPDGGGYCTQTLLPPGS